MRHAQEALAHRPQLLLVHLHTPPEFERHAHRPAGVVLVGGRHPKQDEQAITHRGL